MKGILSKVFIISLFLFSAFYFLSFAPPSFAETPVSKSIQTTSQAIIPQSIAKDVPATVNPSIPNNLHNWTQNVMIEVMLSLTCQLVGVDPSSPNGQCLGVDQKTGKIGFLPAGNLAKGEVGGAIGGMNNMISMLYDPPLHASDYFQNLAQNFGITKKSYASQAGTGFQSLMPLLDLWSAFRNIVYLVFVIVFVVIGLAIMLRIKIDPRTVMTIQNQIPKIIIGILLVTFSFAIAGFLVDLMWVFTYMIFGLISGISNDIKNSVEFLNPTLLQAENPLQAVSTWDMGAMAGNVAHNSIGIIQTVLGITPSITDISPALGLSKDFIGLMLSLLPGHFPTMGSPADFLVNLASTIGAIGIGFKIGTLPALNVGGEIIGIGGQTNVAGIAINLGFAIAAASIVYPLIQEILRIGAPFLIVFIIIFIALFMALFKLWFSLLMAYISILIDVVLAPFWIIGGLIPGSPISAGGWFRDLVANLAAFPAVIFMLLLGRVFMTGFTKAANPFLPPLIGDFSKTSMFSSLIGIGVIMMTPNVVNLIKTALKAPKTDLGGAAKGIIAGASVPMGAGKNIGGLVTAYKYDIAGDRKKSGGLVRMAQNIFK